MNERIRSLVDVSAAKMSLAETIEQDLLDIPRAEKNLLLAETQQEMDEYAERIGKTREQMQADRAEASTLAPQPAGTGDDDFSSF